MLFNGRYSSQPSDSHGANRRVGDLYDMWQDGDSRKLSQSMHRALTGQVKKDWSRIIGEVTDWNDIDRSEFVRLLQRLATKTFGTKEKQAFDEADAAEWKQWLISGAVVLVPASQESGIPKDQIFSAPTRFVRTNKAKESGQLQAKSRLIIPGH